MQSSGQRRLTVTSPLDELSLQGSQTGTPPNGQSSSQLFLDFAHFFHEVSVTAYPTSTFTLGYSVHGTRQEQTDGLINMLFLHRRRQGELGE